MSSTSKCAAVTMISRKELVALRRALQEVPHGKKRPFVKAFAQKHATTTETVYRRMAALPGRVRKRKTRVDAGLRKTPPGAVHRRIAFKTMARAHKAQRAICAKINGEIRQAIQVIQAMKTVDQQACMALRAELSGCIAGIEDAMRPLTRFRAQQRHATPIDKDATSTQAKGA
jgi:hypothetical protein